MSSLEQLVAALESLATGAQSFETLAGVINSNFSSIGEKLDNIHADLSGLLTTDGTIVLGNLDTRLSDIKDLLTSIEAKVTDVETNTDSLRDAALPLPVDQV